MDLCAIGARIKTARERAGLTQEDLAAELEMSPTHISVLERGVKAPKLETLVKIANTLHVSTDTLLQDVVHYAADGIASELSSAVSRLSKKDQERILNAVRALIEKHIHRRSRWLSFRGITPYSSRNASTRKYEPPTA